MVLMNLFQLGIFYENDLDSGASDMWQLSLLELFSLEKNMRDINNVQNT